MEWSAVNSDAVGLPPAPGAVVPESPPPPASAPESGLAPSPLEPAARFARRAAPSAREHGEQREHRDVREAWEMALRRRKWVRWIVSWLPHRLTILIRSLLRVQHLIVAKVRYRWHRSLQLRVVGTTLVISAAVIAVLGFFLTEQIAQGLVLNAESSAKIQMLAGLNTARGQSDVNTEPASGSDAETVMTPAQQRPATEQQRFDQVLRGNRPQRRPAGEAGVRGEVGHQRQPQRLAAADAAQQRRSRSRRRPRPTASRRRCFTTRRPRSPSAGRPSRPSSSARRSATGTSSTISSRSTTSSRRCSWSRRR